MGADANVRRPSPLHFWGGAGMNPFTFSAGRIGSSSSLHCAYEAEGFERWRHQAQHLVFRQFRSTPPISIILLLLLAVRQRLIGASSRLFTSRCYRDSSAVIFAEDTRLPPPFVHQPAGLYHLHLLWPTAPGPSRSQSSRLKWRFAVAVVPPGSYYQSQSPSSPNSGFSASLLVAFPVAGCFGGIDKKIVSSSMIHERLPHGSRIAALPAAGPGPLGAGRKSCLAMVAASSRGRRRFFYGDWRRILLPGRAAVPPLAIFPMLQALGPSLNRYRETR